MIFCGAITLMPRHCFATPLIWRVTRYSYIRWRLSRYRVAAMLRDHAGYAMLLTLRFRRCFDSRHIRRRRLLPPLTFAAAAFH